MILNIVFNNLNLVFSIINPRETKFQSFNIPTDLNKSINDYFLDIKKINYRNNSFDDHIDFRKIDNVRISYQRDTFNENDVIYYSLYGYKYDRLTQTFKNKIQILY